MNDFPIKRTFTIEIMIQGLQKKAIFDSQNITCLI